jgi:amino acid transporter
MNKNLGTMDRTVRIIAALALGILILTGTLTGLPAIILGVLAIVLLLTSFVSFCPLYALFKFSTRSREGAK